MSPEAAQDRKAMIRGLALAAPALIWTAAFFLVPVVAILWLSLFQDGEGPGFGTWQRIAETGFVWSALWNSVWLTGMVTVCALLLAYPLAAAIAFRVAERWQRLVLLLIVLPFWTSYVVRSYAWLLVLAPNGVVNAALLGLGLIEAPLKLSFTSAATVMGFVHFFTMLATLTIYASLVQINPRLLLAARDLGAGPVQVFWRVVLPLSLPGVAAAVFLIIVVTMGDYITPQILGGNKDLVLPQTIMMQILRRNDQEMAAGLSMLLMVVVAIAYVALARRMRAVPT
jgi:spermidine/putrescine transport system permease protein